MGGGPSYSSEVGQTYRQTTRHAFSDDGETVRQNHVRAETTVHADLDVKNKVLESCDSEENPKSRAIVIALDLTLSRGTDAIKVYDGVPKFMGLLKALGYVDNPAISFAGIGDQTDQDRFPLQATYFESGNILDEALGNLRVEQGGGGTGKESYELLAYLYAKKSKLDCVTKREEKGLLFIIGDESPYPEVSAAQVKALIGDDLPGNISTEQIFRELRKLYKVFFLYPKMSDEDRKKGIESEIKKRAREAGGQVDNVDIRATLLWNTRDDLDIHMITPANEHIFYQKKRVQSGGWLDIDMNVQGESLKPVENIRYASGVAPSGKYRVYVQNYGFHDNEFHSGGRKDIPYQVEIEINGEVQFFEGVTQAGKSGSQSDVEILEFDYDPSARQETNDVQEAYADETILHTWRSLIPDENVITLEDPDEIIDTLLGIVAIVTGREDGVDSFVSRMLENDTTEQRGAALRKNLDFLAEQTALVAKVDTSELPARVGNRPRVESQEL
jgi:hypothetical protein